MTAPPASLGAGIPIRTPYATQPFNRVVWPGEVWWGATSPPVVFDVATARRIPAVGRALGIYGGMIKQMSMDAYRGVVPLPRPRILEQPDLSRGTANFVQVNVEDYLCHGNALGLVTTRAADGWPSSLLWIPAAWIALVWHPDDPLTLEYYPWWDMSRPLPIEDVVHVRRGADPYCPARGVGVVEEFVTSLDRVGREESYERDMLIGSAVPSVAVVTPNPRLSQDEADAGQKTFIEKYGGGGRVPGVFPAGTVVTPLAWSPSDAQLNEARQTSLTDVANMFGLDGYWLGAPGSSMTYKSPAPMYTNLLRTGIESVLVDFEDTWSGALLPRGQRVRFNRQPVLRDDLQSTVLTLRQAVEAGLYTRDEARAYLGLPLLGEAIPQVGVLGPAARPPDDDALEEVDSAGTGDDLAAEEGEAQS